ncbi:N-acyl homoserine lactonase family protein [Amycolatopsis pigmentata]|uniref:N-acyl homoserine lactonase family protein n=1 Tax=Amycolatopsis pigmentata TaxID=450801 RepID=A0ABW5FLI3_9PSEU
MSETAAPSVPLEVVQVTYGERVTQKSVVLHDYAAYGRPDGDLRMDYNFWIIRAGDTVILKDTGYDISARDWLGEQVVKDTPEALELLGIDPAGVTMVITSHFHYDHIGYLGLFTNAQVVSGTAEYEYWFGKWDNSQLEGEFTIAEHLEAVRRAEREGRLRLVSEETEVFPGITVYPVGGHCPGELLTLVRAQSGPLILASDAAHFYEQIENEWPFFAFTDLGQMRSALSFINKLAGETGATVIPGHDGRVREKFPPVEGPASDIATVLS